VFNDQNGNRTNNYKGKSICTIPTTSVHEENIKPDLSYDGQTIRIMLNNDMQSLLAMHLYDVQGRLINTHQGDIMPLNGIQGGVYFLKLSPLNTMHTIVHQP